MPELAGIVISQPDTEPVFRDYLHFRWQHLRAPWGEPEGSETDALENQCHHLVAHDGQLVVAVARLQFNTAQQAQVRYMAVAPDYRRLGLGSKIMRQLEAAAIDRHAREIILDARENAVPFYQQLGYKITGKSYLLFDEIQHFSMRKTLTGLSNTTSKATT